MLKRRQFIAKTIKLTFAHKKQFMTLSYLHCRKKKRILCESMQNLEPVELFSSGSRGFSLMLRIGNRFWSEFGGTWNHHEWVSMVFEANCTNTKIWTLKKLIKFEVIESFWRDLLDFEQSEISRLNGWCLDRRDYIFKRGLLNKAIKGIENIRKAKNCTERFFFEHIQQFWGL